MTKYNSLSGFILVLGIMFNSCCETDSKPGVPEENIKSLDVPRIDFVVMAEIQPHQNNPNVIWYDDFNNGENDYMESSGDIDPDESFGGSGGSMKAGFKQGAINGEGNRKLAFGDFPDPDNSINVAQRGRQFNDIYWRIYVKHEYGWQGAPAKMSRATSIVSGNWQQAMISHVWSGKNNSLTLDPASGVDGQSSNVITTKYNDFDNLTWLGNKPSSEFQISSTGESGYWVLVESRAKLNTPGKSDGLARLWIDGRLEAEREDLNFRGSYTDHGINAVFLESYWNGGSIKTQGRWYDNFIVSTKTIEPVVCPSNPTLYKTPYQGPEDLAAWEVELATNCKGDDIVYKSKELGKKENVEINVSNGSFCGSLNGKSDLSSENTYFCRVHQKSTNGEWSDWSRWHQNFEIEEEPGELQDTFIALQSN